MKKRKAISKNLFSQLNVLKLYTYMPLQNDFVYESTFRAVIKTFKNKQIIAEIQT
jgi:hypothetical protein